MAWSYSLLGRHFTDPAPGRRVRNYARPRAFDLPGPGRRRLVRADFSDQHTLTRDLGVPVRTCFGLDARLATATLGVLTRVPGGRHAPRSVPLPGGDGWLVLGRAADGTARWATGRGQSAATVRLTVDAVLATERLPAGVHRLHRVLRLDDVAAGSAGSRAIVVDGTDAVTREGGVVGSGRAGGGRARRQPAAIGRGAAAAGRRNVRCPRPSGSGSGACDLGR